MSVLYRPAPVLDAAAALLRVVLPAGIIVEVDAAQWVPRQVTLEHVTGPTPTTLGMGGPDWAVMGVQATCVGADRADARLIADEVRVALAGKDRLGRPLHPMVVTGAHVDEVSSDNDGRLTQNAPPTWVETYLIRYQAVTPPPAD